MSNNMQENQDKPAAVDAPVVNAPTISNSDRLKQIADDKKKLREEEKRLREARDADKEVRKKAQNAAARAKAEVMEKRKNMTNTMRLVNGLMLSKSIKNNLEEFKAVSDEFNKCADEFSEANEAYINILVELEKYE